ncbi:MAG TPA: RluA family pseudouridine synthase [Candidatus Tetragenococcus pullicola]|nr:RluA family pseudouridine synthase [Candidatus Tetragenococcus pullicola]
MDYTIVLPSSQQTLTLRELLEEEWLIPRKVRHFLRVRKNVWINNEPAHFQQPVKAGDHITLRIEATDYSYQEVMLGDKNKIIALYEDEHIIIINKPIGMKTHPNQPDEKDTLLNHLNAYLAEKKQRAYVVHRLDKETSGAILFAKNPLVLPILGRLLEQKKIYRRYQVVVWGRMSKNQLIDKPIGRNRHDRRKRVIDHKHGKRALTQVTVHKTSTKTSQLFCELETGRTHQIRVHLASIGHPVVGDPLYQNKKSTRLMLHAYEMYFLHPFTKEEMKVVAKPGLWTD